MEDQPKSRNTENGSEHSTTKSSDVGYLNHEMDYQKLVKEKADSAEELAENQESYRLERPLFARFLKVPYRLSNVFAWVVMAFFIFHIPTPLCLDWYFLIPCCLGIGALIGVAGIFAQILTEREMIRRRLWEWARYNFDDYDEFVVWVRATPATQLDYLASLPDGSWEAHADGGGIRIPDWKPEDNQE